MESNDRGEALKFPELAKRAFSFLLDRHFHVIREEATSLRYESSRVYVDVYRDYLSYHIDFTVGTLGHPKDRVSMFELTTLAGASPLTDFQPLTAEQMEVDLAELARILDTYGRRALEGDPAIFEALNLRRRAYTQKYMRRSDPSDRHDE